MPTPQREMTTLDKYVKGDDIVVISIEFSPLSTVELTTNWYQLHNGDYEGILEHSFGNNYLQLSATTFGNL